MKIAIDISQIAYIGTGVSSYLKNMILGLTKYDKENQYLLFFSSFRGLVEKELLDLIKKNKNFSFRKLPFPPTFLEIIWNRLHIFPIEKFLGDFDLLLTSDWTEPPSKFKKITVIHDLVFIKFPHLVDKKIIEVQSRRIKWIKKESSLVIADSFTTKRDIIDCLKFPSKKIEVVYPGVKIKKISQKRVSAVLKKFNLKPKKFILTVGKLEPRKNLLRLIEGFLEANLTEKELVIIGSYGWDKKLLEQKNNFPKTIKFLGFVSNEELYSLYSSALFFVFPSLYEGFGYPVVEAMMLKCPVCCSNIPTNKEIIKENAIYFDPLSSSSIKKAIITLEKDKFLRETLKIKAYEQAKNFTLEKFIKNLLKVFKKAIKNDHRH